MVFARGMSRPDSTMAVVTSTSVFPEAKSSMVLESSLSPMRPCATPTEASGSSSLTNLAFSNMSSILLCTKNTVPPLAISFSAASLTAPGLNSRTYTSTGWRPSGGVFITLMSLTSASES